MGLPPGRCRHQMLKTSWSTLSALDKIAVTSRPQVPQCDHARCLVARSGDLLVVTDLGLT